MCIVFLYTCAIWTLFSPLVAPDRGPGSPPRTSRLESLDATQVMKKYLQLPVFLHSRLPLVEKVHFFPSSGTGQEPLPGPVREILFPVPQTENPPAASNATSVKTLCEVNRMHVQVQRSVLGAGGSSSPLRLGTCRASRSTTDSLYFEYDLGSCGSTRTMINNRVAFENTLRYDPPRIPGPIRRAAPFSLPVVCLYDRYQYSYKIGYIPKIQMHKIFKPMMNRAKFIINPRNAKWERLSPSDHYVTGRPMYFEAEAPSMSADDRLYVQSCHATLRRCMVESKDNRSRFIPHKKNVVRFTVDAFLFKGTPAQQLYMHCTMSVGSPVPTPTAKSCTYDTTARRWRELYGSASVCACCDSATASCQSTASTVTRMVSSRPWTIESRATPTTTPKGKAAAATTPTKKTRKTTQTATTSLPEETGGVRRWGEAEVEEGHVKGFALVEEEEEEDVTELRRIFEDIFYLEK
ncbi:zona pellucida sperm-binding protein 3d.2 [Diretmus argenteus]